jgi:hypothetical protein
VIGAIFKRELKSLSRAVCFLTDRIREERGILSHMEAERKFMGSKA